MEKLIYNTRVKKLLVSLIVIILVMNSLMPSIVWAISRNDIEYTITEDEIKVIIKHNVGNGTTQEHEIEDYSGKAKDVSFGRFEVDASGGGTIINESHYIAAGTYSNMIASVRDSNFADGLANKFLDRFDESATESSMISSVKNEIIRLIESNNFETISEEIIENEVYLERICAKYIDQLDKILVIADAIDNRNYEGTAQNNSLIVTFAAIVNLTEEEINEAINDETLGPIDYSGNEVEVSFGDVADALGGILLSPIFWLVNFVVDSVTETLGTIMLNEGLSLDGVWGGDILTVQKIAVPDGEAIDHKVNISSFLLSAYQYPSIKYTPEEIFSGTVKLLSIDFITGKTAHGGENDDEGWVGIRTVISSWYKILRWIAIIGFLSVLIYMGIKIIISANAKDKAKYKQWLVDWFMGVAILFTMHFIMAFIVTVTGEFSNLLGESCGKINVALVNAAGTTVDTFVTNLMGLVRFMIQSESFIVKVAYEIMYVMLVTYTVKFTLLYLKRVLNVAFLTLIAPIVALMYPLDKINDGNAQSFNMWLKDYIFNALLQPMHLLLYYILLGSAVGVAAANPIYGIVVLTFLSEAERLLKKFFGFEKAGGGTVGGMAGAFAAGAIASNIKNIARMGAGGGSKGGSGLEKDNDIDNPKGFIKSGVENFSMSDDQLIGGQGNGGQGGGNQGGGNQGGGGQGGGNQGGGGQGGGNQGGGGQGGGNQGGGGQGGGNQGGGGQGGGGQGGGGQGGGATGTQDQGISIKKMAKALGKGTANVTKKLIRPVYDTRRGFGANAKRWGRRLGKAAIGGAVGITAAAVQAGISLTDGKYNPMEGIATFTAGYAGGNKLAKSIGDTFMDGVTQGDKQAAVERAQRRFDSRQDVLDFNEKNYPGEEAKRIEREKNTYLARGITDLKEMKSGMKYADELIKQGVDKDVADQRAANILNFEKELKANGVSGVVFDEKKRKEYIQNIAGGNAEMQRNYENAFKSLIEFKRITK